MSVKNYLTNEKVSGKFEDPFMLVNYAIGIARRKIARGDIGDNNLSSEILDAIADGRDVYEMQEEDEEIEDEEEIEVKFLPKTPRKNEELAESRR